MVVVVWVTAFVGVFLSGFYFLAAIRIWQRRSKSWALVAFANALIYSGPTASYVYHALIGDRPLPDELPWGLLLFVLPALLVLRFIVWGIQDEADAREVIDHLEDA